MRGRVGRGWPHVLTSEAPDTGSLAGDPAAICERVGRDDDIVTSDLLLIMGLL
jgi:hypothetical protein